MTTPQINHLVCTPDGVAIARLRMQQLSVRPLSDGTKALQVQHGEHSTTFFLDKEQCSHLATLLTA